jgi:hypothetical protein
MTERNLDRLYKRLMKITPPFEGYVFQTQGGNFFVTNTKLPIGGQRLIYRIQQALVKDIKKSPDLRPPILPQGVRPLTVRYLAKIRKALK